MAVRRARERRGPVVLRVRSKTDVGASGTQMFLGGSGDDFDMGRYSSIAASRASFRRDSQVASRSYVPMRFHWASGTSSSTLIKSDVSSTGGSNRSHLCALAVASVPNDAK